MMAAAISAVVPVVSLAQQAGSNIAATSPATTGYNGVLQDLQSLGQLLSDPVAPQPQRDEAARRLASRESDDAKATLRQILVDGNNPRSQLAVAKALSEVTNPDPQFIDPLRKLLGPDARLTGAVADALALYKMAPVAVTALCDFAAQSLNAVNAKPIEPARIAAIKAIGTLVDQQAAETLIGLLRSDLESDAIHIAATNALQGLTGQTDYGHDAGRWMAWWDEIGKLPADEFRARTFAQRALRTDVLDRREQDLAARLRTALNEQYFAVPREQKPTALLRYLTDESPVVRAFAAGLVVEEARNANPPTPAMRERLRAMISDSDTDVRIEVASALRSVNDPAALDVLRAQLAQERSTDARIAQIGALGTIGDPRAVLSVLPLVDDPSQSVSLAAIRALGQLGPAVKQNDPTATTQVREKLVEILKGPAARAGEETLRATTVGALAPYADNTFTTLFVQLLNARESSIVRIAALNAMATVGDAKVSDRIPELFDPKTTDRGVRLAAVRALGALGAFEHASALLVRMDPTQEPDAEVRTAAESSLNRILPSGNPAGLRQLADQFRRDPAKRLNVLKVLVDKLQPDNDANLAGEQQNLGQVQSELGLHREAAEAYRSALVFWRTQNGSQAIVDSITGRYLRELLKSGQFSEASQFAADSIARDAEIIPTVYQQVRGEVDELRVREELTNALRLVAAFKPIKLQRYNSTLQELEGQLQIELNGKAATRPAGNALPPPMNSWLQGPVTLSA